MSVVVVGCGGIQTENQSQTRRARSWELGAGGYQYKELGAKGVNNRTGAAPRPARHANVCIAAPAGNGFPFMQPTAAMAGRGSASSLQPGLDRLLSVSGVRWVCVWLLLMRGVLFCLRLLLLRGSSGGFVATCMAHVNESSNRISRQP